MALTVFGSDLGTSVISVVASTASMVFSDSCEAGEGDRLRNDRSACSEERRAEVEEQDAAPGDDSREISRESPVDVGSWVVEEAGLASKKSMRRSSANVTR